MKGLADDGGLFVPESIPKLDVTLDELKGMSYQETAYAVMKQFFTDFTEEELKHCINSAYDSKFDTEVIAPLVKVGDTYHWSCSTEQRSHLRIWLCRFCRIFLLRRLRKIM